MPGRRLIPAASPTPSASGSAIKRIAYYISAHGYGHAARSAVVLRTLCPDYEVFLRTEIPESFFKQQAGPVRYRPLQVDTGCIQSSFVTVDSQASFDWLETFYAQADRRLAEETDWIRAQGIDLVISDVAPWPLKAAAHTRLPGLLIANFTWHDIYAHFPEARNYPALVDRMRDEYASATLQFLPQLHLSGGVVRNQREVGLLALAGQNIRERLCHRLTPDFKDRIWVFIYAGQYDAACMQWQNLASLKDCVFLTRDPLPPADLPDNLVVLDETFAYPDLMASADLVVTKGGYSTLATAFYHHKPVLSCDRPDFREFAAVRACLEEKGIGVVLDTAHFLRGDWAEAIKKALKMTVKGKMRLHGEHDIRATIDRLLLARPTLSG